MKTNKNKNQTATVGYKRCVTDMGLNYNGPCPERQ